MLVSWLLLEKWHWGLIPQLQPMRALLFVTLGMQLMCASAAMLAKRRGETAMWLVLAIAPSVPAMLARYPHLHTPELAQLSDWARANTPKDAVFLFADSGRNLAPGIFRSEALRAVYVDWKGGGQVNYFTQASAASLNPTRPARAAAMNGPIGQSDWVGPLNPPNPRRIEYGRMNTLAESTGMDATFS